MFRIGSWAIHDCVVFVLILLLANIGQLPAKAATCLDAARHAEQRAGLPAGLLAAIGRVESGNWNWSVNGNSRSFGRRFASAEEAETYTRSLLDSGRQLIDLGCFQVDLLYHPDAFARWQDAFDSERNAAAAADILNQFYQRTGDWNQAVSLYHSANPLRSKPYLMSVLSAWKNIGPDMIASVPMTDPYVIALAPVSVPVMIWVPVRESPSRSPMHGRSILPRVVTP